MKICILWEWKKKLSLRLECRTIPPFRCRVPQSQRLFIEFHISLAHFLCHCISFHSIGAHLVPLITNRSVFFLIEKSSPERCIPIGFSRCFSFIPRGCVRMSCASVKLIRAWIQFRIHRNSLSCAAFVPRNGTASPKHQSLPNRKRYKNEMKTRRDQKGMQPKVKREKSAHNQRDLKRESNNLLFMCFVDFFEYEFTSLPNRKPNFTAQFKIGNLFPSDSLLFTHLSFS